MSVSIVIVNFRAYRELHVCLESLGAQIGGGLRVVVVDQAPERAEIDRLRARFQHVTLVESAKNRGFASAVNLGARQSDSDYLLILNPDCEISPDSVTRLAAWLDAHPEAGAVGPRVRDRSGAIQASARRFPDITTAFAGRSSWLTRAFPGNPLSRLILPVPAEIVEVTEVDWVSGACVMVRRRAFDAVGGMDPGFFLYWEDADLGRRLKNAGWATFYCPDVETIHAVGRSSRFVPVRSAIAFHRSALRYYWKHSSAISRLLAPIVAIGLGARLLLLLSWNCSRQLARFVHDRVVRKALTETH